MAKDASVKRDQEKAKEQQRQAIAAAVAGARKVVSDSETITNTPTGGLKAETWNQIITAALSAWAQTRTETLIADGSMNAQVSRETGIQPDPHDIAIVRSILPELADRAASIDWSQPLAEWSSDRMIAFLMAAWRLISRAEAAYGFSVEGYGVNRWIQREYPFPISLGILRSTQSRAS